MRMKPYTVIWLMRGNPVLNRIFLGPNHHATGYVHDTWVAHALIDYWKENGRTITWDDAYLEVEDTGHSLVAVIEGHAPLVYEP